MTDDELDDLIDQWHDSNDPRPLWEYLNMSEDEYSHWIETGEREY